MQIFNNNLGTFKAVYKNKNITFLILINFITLTVLFT